LNQSLKWYRDGAGDTSENSSIFLIKIHHLSSASEVSRV